ncbi:MAG: alcohol dehydrogenase catalytic domain-containing protein [Nitrosopumilus sp.]|uniref:alcohol dehydrogenase catalytic domain-containing protein n=1 Tax=Nitrosopumilus sp. TaxID=2024843 RepID=UPI00246F0345|nr:alcohol dehydrogenase catalytic domain-containing protein [Nitrosopumilus sp.]MDH5430951.1 alcohol dehydrogenase catalytic domain-containing protein [Nitrosopumilus sp.]MDH5664954.1 alcohol dehydrogenase catalytic domain-containing protein [Nitrosopumilus sp.]MDH5697115.1 alcohol dehydrogenase catalytic domain-containing protein [Nitrosopumilus sp.]
MEKMRAMVLEKCAKIETNPLKLTQIDRHEIKRPNEILIKIEACGVCHSQLHGIEGDWQNIGIPPALPTVPGHEVVGKVVEIGDNVTKFKVGDRAGITPLLEACQECQYCKEGKEYLCESSIILGESTKGGYTEYVTVTEDFATKVPDNMKAEYAAPLFCAGITSYKAVKAAEPKPNKKIGIFGIGGVGHMAVQFAKVENCKIIAFSRSQKHLDVAKRLGATDAIVFSEDQQEFLDKLKEKHGLLDAAIVFAPADIVTDTAIKSVKKGGLIVIATVGKNPTFMAFEEKTIRGTLIGSTKDMEQVIKICDEKKLEVISQIFPLEQANEALKKLKDSEIEARAVLIP